MMKHFTNGTMKHFDADGSGALEHDEFIKFCEISA